MRPVSVQVITYAPTVFYHCQHCELTFQEMGIGDRLRRREAAEALPDDLTREFQAVSDWVHGLLQRHGGRVRVDVLDAASIRGFLASLRHRVGRYPAVIVDGRDKRIGLDFAALDPLIDRRVAAAREPGRSLPRSDLGRRQDPPISH
jgi:hypothetical protein